MHMATNESQTGWCGDVIELELNQGGLDAAISDCNRQSSWMKF